MAKKPAPKEAKKQKQAKKPVPQNVVKTKVNPPPPGTMDESQGGDAGGID